jgi:hypothetical protein
MRTVYFSDPSCSFSRSTTRPSAGASSRSGLRSIHSSTPLSASDSSAAARAAGASQRARVLGAVSFTVADVRLARGTKKNAKT